MQVTNTKWPEVKPALNATLVDVIVNKMNFSRLMPVQQTVVPLFITNYDVAVESCTGSGKTLSFLVPMLHKYIETIKHRSAKAGIFGLIISPTRELAIQIHSILNDFVTHLREKNINVRTALFIGGTKTSIKAEEIEVDIMIATPGRLRELLYERNDIELNVRNLEYLVLDEADRLIDNDHRIDVKQIIAKLPKQRRTGLFSATLTGINMSELIKYGLRNPAKIKLKAEAKRESSHAVPDKLENSFAILGSRVDKIAFLVSLIQKHEGSKVMVFFNTCDSVEFYYKLLKRILNTSILKTYGKMKQQQRTKVFKEFNEATSGVLMTTDVMARGADFPNVSQIIQVDPPQNPDFFIHRIGRTARGESGGKALLLVTRPEVALVHYLNDRQILMTEETVDANIKEFGDTIFSKLRTIMVEDRDNFEKAKRAFVSFVRSYKEHQLKDVFKFDQLDLTDAAQSFLLPFVPVMKETKGLKGKLMIDQKYYEQYKETSFKDKNQQKQFDANKDKLLEKRAAMKKENVKVQRKITKDNDKKKLRTFQERKRAKEREVVNDFNEFSYEEKLAKKLKRNKISKDKFNELVSKIDKKYEDSD